MAASNVPASFVMTTLVAFILFYTALAVVDFYLMIKYIRIGPEKAFLPHDPDPLQKSSSKRKSTDHDDKTDKVRKRQ
jgi:cytochrome bd-type quinol oxidase subunit 1